MLSHNTSTHGPRHTFCESIFAGSSFSCHASACRKSLTSTFRSPSAPPSFHPPCCGWITRVQPAGFRPEMRHGVHLSVCSRASLLRFMHSQQMFSFKNAARRAMRLHPRHGRRSWPLFLGRSRCVHSSVLGHAYLLDEKDYVYHHIAYSCRVDSASWLHHSFTSVSLSTRHSVHQSSQRPTISCQTSSAQSLCSRPAPNRQDEHFLPPLLQPQHTHVPMSPVH